MSDDEALSALIDGALPDEQATALRQRLAQEPALARRLTELSQVDDALRATFAGIADEPLPQRVLDTLRPPVASIVRRPRFSGLHVAAVAGLAAGFLIAFLILPREEPTGPPAFLAQAGVVDQSSALDDVLQSLPSRQSRSIGSGWSATPVLTFRSTDGRACRRVDFEGAGQSLQALACRNASAWRIELVGFGATTTNAPGSGELYHAASGGPPSRVDAAISAMIDGPPLSAEAEREWIGRGFEGAGGP